MILMISFISSFKINKVNPFPTLRLPFPLIFLSNVFIAVEAKLLTYPGKSSLTKGIAIFVSKLPSQKPNDPPDLIILDIWALQSFAPAEILLAKAFLILVVYLVRKESWGNSSFSKFSLFILNTVPVLFFAADFNLLNHVFVILTLTS